jgi:hypothetical protein
MLLDKAPLRNNTRYITVKSFVQFLYPGIGACDIKVHPSYQDEWHVDMDLGDHPYAWHIITSACTSRTEFQVEPVEFHMNNILGLRSYLNDNVKKLGLRGRKIDAQKFCTFTNHIHRPTPPEKPEFRYFFRVQETDYKEPEPLDRAIQRSVEDRYNGSTVHFEGVQRRNLEHRSKGINIYYPWNGWESKEGEG